MIKNHHDILALWKSCGHLAKRIGEEYSHTMDAEDIRKLKKTLETAKDRNHINSKHWRYIVRVASKDYANEAIKLPVTLDLLVDKQGVK